MQLTVKEATEVFARNWKKFSATPKAAERVLELAKIVSRKSQRAPEYFKDDAAVLKFCRYYATSHFKSDLDNGHGRDLPQTDQCIRVLHAPDNNQAALRDLPAKLHPLAKELIENPQPLTQALVRERFPGVSNSTAYAIQSRIVCQLKGVLCR